MTLSISSRLAVWLLAIGLLFAVLGQPVWAQAPVPTPPVPPSAHHRTSAPAPKIRLITKKNAVLLGVVEGLTEFLPISSTGHLLLTQRLMHITSTEGAKDQDKQETALNAYTTIIQFGAILAILLLYFGRIREVFAGFFGKNPKGLRLGLNLIYAFLPAAVIGYPVEKLLQHYLFNAWGIWPTVIAWGVGGIAILVVSALQRARLQAVATDAETSAAVQSVGVDELTPKQAFTIGLMQCIAMWPGVSRSLATIFGGLVAGMSMAAAVEFSFLLGFVTLTAATIFELRHFSVIHHYLGSSSPVIGIIFAGIAAFVAVKWMVSYLNKHGLEIFGYYRVVLAIATVALVVMNVLK